jgi:hypothetical protein
VIWSGRYAAASLAGIADGVMMKIGDRLNERPVVCDKDGSNAN